jgi:hydroxyacylglutathione hydrolase
MKDIFCLTGGVLGTNTYIVPLANNECFVVDPAVDAERIAEKIASAGLRLTAILLTHGHYDHMESLQELSLLYPQAKIAIHSEDVKSLGKDALLRHYAEFASTGLVQLYAAFQGDFEKKPHLPEADFFLKGGEVFENEWLVLHTPGHTRGCICLYNEKKKQLLSGDTLFYMGWGRTDLEGGDQRALQTSLKRLFDLPSETKVFPGHEQYGFSLAETNASVTRGFLTI